MRRFFSLAVLALAAGVLTGCKPEEIIETEDIPTAGIRFINLVPDTGAVDFRPVDIVENSTFYNMTFRSTTLFFYKNARAGSRNFRIFMNGTTPEIASQVVKDTTVTLEAGKLYTFILWGYARAGSSPGRRLTIIEDSPADPGANVALRMINAGAGLGALDGRQYPNGGTAPATPTWANVAELSASAYVTVAPGQVRYNVQPAGGGTNLFADALALAGSPKTVDLDALPGTTVAGSAVTGFVVPRSVAGSQAASFTTPGIIFAWDRRPPR